MEDLVRYVRALVWLRWRMIMRSLARGRRRDLLERFSIALETIAPIVAVIMIVPAGLGFGVLGFIAGYWVGQPAGTTVAGIVQFILLFACGFAVFSPLVFPANAQASGQLRLLLLPIPRGVLYAVQTLGVLADPWIAVIVPLFVGVPIGLAAAGRLSAAFFAIGGGVLMIVLILGLAMLSTAVLQLVLRNRRRGERAMVAVMLAIVATSMLPSFVLPSLEERRERRRLERSMDGRGARDSDARVARFASAVAMALPPGYYMRAARTAAAGRLGAAAGWTAGLALAATALHVAGWLTYNRLLETPATSGMRQTQDRARSVMRRVPGLSAGASAVAWAFVRLVLRTPRGKMALFGSILTVPFFSVMLLRSGEVPFLFAALSPGVSLAMIGLGITLLSLSPIALNQFASDGAGLTLECLSPITERDLLMGKAAGSAMVLAFPAMFVMIVAVIMSPSMSPWLWIALGLGGISAYMLMVPVNAVLSAILPRKVNLAGIGRDSNAHQGANLLGLIGLLLAAAPAGLAAGAAIFWLDSLPAAALLVAAWAAVASGIAWLAMRPVATLVAARKENLLFVAQGR
ncbi:MAG TPA: hypothetical protein VHJ77_01855 [Vicinamibacterales bacterium]|nr:hypothetical protein [Vicinamibacterales bacterium]